MEERLHQIEQELGAVRTDVAGLRAECVTRADLGLVRDGLSDLKGEVEGLRKQSATKDDLGLVREDVAAVKGRITHLEAACQRASGARHGGACRHAQDTSR